MTASPSTRTASAWPVPSRPPSTATSRPPRACSPGSSRGSTGPRRRATGRARTPKRRARTPPVDVGRWRRPTPVTPPWPSSPGSTAPRCSNPCSLTERARPSALVPVRNAFFGGNIAVTGLMTGADIARVLRDEPPGQRYLLPDVCLSEGRFLDGMTVAELPRPVEIVPSDGHSLRLALQSGGAATSPPPGRPLAFLARRRGPRSCAVSSGAAPASARRPAAVGSALRAPTVLWWSSPVGPTSGSRRS